MEKFEVYLNDWTFNMGLVGYVKILAQFDGTQVSTSRNQITIEKEHLRKIPEAFFTYYIKHYDVAKRESNHISYLLNRALNDIRANKSGDLLKDLVKYVQGISKKVDKYFADTSEAKAIHDAIDHINKWQSEIKKKALIDIELLSKELADQTKNISNALSTRVINEKRTVNFFKAAVLTDSYGQVSFLNVSKNASSVDEQKSLMQRDFVQPILSEFAFLDALDQDDIESMQTIINDGGVASLDRFKKAVKKENMETIRQVLADGNSCSFTGFPLIIDYFSEGHFSPIALSLPNYRNMAWHGDIKTYLPISALAKLIYFCAEAGSSTYTNGNFYVHMEGDFEQIYQLNSYLADETTSRGFSDKIFSLSKSLLSQAKKNQGSEILLYQFTSNYSSKSTKLNYLNLSKKLSQFFVINEKLLMAIHYENRDQIMTALLRNNDPVRIINIVLRKSVTEGYSISDVLNMVQVRLNYQLMKRGDEGMNKIAHAKLYSIRKSAQAVAKEVTAKSGSNKKVKSLAYRLLNLVNSNNKHGFLDAVMRIYLPLEEPMPNALLEVLTEDNLDFATVGQEFIAGLFIKPYAKESEKTSVELTK